MNTLAETYPNGVKVSQNACVLSAGIEDDDATVTLDDPDIFAQNSYVSIEEECVKVTDADTNPRTITREQADHNGNATTADDHAAGCFLRDRDGAEVLTYDFDGDTYFAGAYVHGERGFWVALEVDGVIKPVKMCDTAIPYLEFTFPRYKPAEATWKILVWTTETRQFWAGFYN